MSIVNKVANVIEGLYERYQYKMIGCVLIAGGLVPVVISRDGTFAILAFMLGIPMLFAKGE